MYIDIYGKDAKRQATQRVLDMFNARDRAGEAVWTRILDCILKLEAVRPAPGAKVH